jgi:hypothetical protein
MFLGCAGRGLPPPAVGSALSAAESLYAVLRDVRDQIDVALAAGHNGITDVTPVVHGSGVIISSGKPSLLGCRRWTRRSWKEKIAAHCTSCAVRSSGTSIA